MQVWGQRAEGLVDGKAVIGTRFWDWERRCWAEVVSFVAIETSELLNRGPEEINGMADRRPPSDRIYGT